MDNRSNAWSVTINNPTSTDEEYIQLARQKGWKVEGQVEQGEEGTPHYQLLVKTPQVRFSAVKKAFPRGHVEKARNVVALQQYVTKQDTRLGQLPSTQEQYPSLSKFWDLILNQFDAFNYLDCDDYPKTLWKKETGNRPILSLFDDAVGNLIDEGYHVESIVVNPATRSMFKLYWRNILYRSHRTLETNRQTDNDALESEVSLPVLSHNNAGEEDSEEKDAPSSQSGPSSDN